MKLSWSHTVLNVHDLNAMIDYYTSVLGFSISDRGPLGPNAPEIVFLSTDPDEHHQLALVADRQSASGSSALNHLAFRLPSFDELKVLHHRLVERGDDILPLSHGNTLSLYFNDPEGNGLEVFWDTPWKVAQPQVEMWDPSLDKEAALQWVEAHFAEHIEHA